MSLSPEEAADIVGVPAIQLERWAYLGQGPDNIGTKWKPRFTEAGLMDWQDKMSITPMPVLSPANPEN